MLSQTQKVCDSMLRRNVKHGSIYVLRDAKLELFQRNGRLIQGNYGHWYWDAKSYKVPVHPFEDKWVISWR